MAYDINRVVLVGRLVRDPELRPYSNGNVCKFSIANGRSYATKGGEKKEETSFFNCTAWGRQGEIIHQYCKKGSQVIIEGRLQQRSWEDKEGKKQSSVDIIVENLQMLSKRESSGRGDEGAVYEPNFQASPEIPEGFDDDDDIPF